MAQVRKQPLPVGRYWISVISPTSSRDTTKADNFRAWIKSNPQRLALEKEERGDGSFFIFRVVNKPITFDQRQFGFPNVADAGVQAAADTAQRPPTPTTADAVADIFAPIRDAIAAAAATSGGRIALIAGLVFLASKSD